jgi:hypothetical protein
MELMVQVGDTPGAALHGIAVELAKRTRRYELRRDSRCVFTYCYCIMTAQLERDLAATTGIDRAWIADLAVAFSNRYFKALDDYDTNPDHPDLPCSWRAVFRAAKQRYNSVLEDLVCGIAAHIVADLPHAIVEVGLKDRAGRSRIADYHAVNAMLGGAIDLISDRVGRRYAYPLYALERLSPAEALLLTDYGLRMSRSVAWYNAQRLTDPQLAPAAANSIQKSAEMIVEQIANPPFWSVRTLLRAWRVLLSLVRRWPREHEPLSVDGIANW